MLDTLGVRVGKKTMEKLAEASLNAKSFDELLATLPGEERSKVLKAISDPATWTTLKPAVPKAAMGVGGVVENPDMPPMNNLAPQAPTNALVR